MIQIQEHELLTTEQDSRYDDLELVKWDKPMAASTWGYYASFRIGAEWIDEREALVVTTKSRMENIDFLGMFMTCFTSDLALDSFSKIYTIDLDKPAIEAPSLRNVMSLLMIVHFISVVGRIKSLKRGYVHYSENLKKVKGRINILKNERLNIAAKRYDRIYCDYDEYTADIPENRLIKKALLFSRQFVNLSSQSYSSQSRLKQMINQAVAMFEQVSDDVEIREVRQIRANKLFKEYHEAIRLGKLILRHFDYSISKMSGKEATVTPFTIDMSLLYEHYVYGLLHAAYGNEIKYQASSLTGKPDFLYLHEGGQAILDTKYIPKFENDPLDTYIVRQLSGYSRDLGILHRLGYKYLDEESPIPPVPCVIIYPREGISANNSFNGKELKSLYAKVGGLLHFYKICVPLPTIG